jgi:hypothetical protein
VAATQPDTIADVIPNVLLGSVWEATGAVGTNSAEHFEDPVVTFKSLGPGFPSSLFGRKRNPSGSTGLALEVARGS